MLEGGWEKVVAFALGILVLVALVVIALQSTALGGILPGFAKIFSAQKSEDGCDVRFMDMYKQRTNAFNSLEFNKIPEICKLIQKCYEPQLDNKVLFPKGPNACTCTDAKYYQNMLSKIVAGKIKSKSGPSVTYPYPFGSISGDEFTVLNYYFDCWPEELAKNTAYARKILYFLTQGGQFQSGKEFVALDLAEKIYSQSPVPEETLYVADACWSKRENQLYYHGSFNETLKSRCDSYIMTLAGKLKDSLKNSAGLEKYLIRDFMWQKYNAKNYEEAKRIAYLFLDMGPPASYDSYTKQLLFSLADQYLGLKDYAAANEITQKMVMTLAFSQDEDAGVKRADLKAAEAQERLSGFLWEEAANDYKYVIDKIKATSVPANRGYIKSLMNKYAADVLDPQAVTKAYPYGREAETYLFVNGNNVDKNVRDDLWVYIASTYKSWDNEYTHINLLTGNIMQKMKAYEAAKIYAEVVLPNHMISDELGDEIGRDAALVLANIALLKESNYAKAKQYYTLVLQKYPDNAEAKEGLAVANSKLGS